MFKTIACLRFFPPLILCGCLSSAEKAEDPETMWDPGPYTRADAPLDTAWITAAGADSGRLYIGTNHAFYVDAGSGFTRPLSGPAHEMVWRIAVSGERVLVDGAMQVSTDAGATWSPFPIPAPWGPAGEFVGTTFQVTPAGSLLFAYATGGKFLSRDLGAHWAPFVLDADTLVVGQQGDARVACSRNGCWASSDGVHFRDAKGLTPTPIAYALRTYGGFWVLSREGQSGEILLSRDGGADWIPSHRFAGLEALALSPKGRLFAIGEDFRLYTSLDGLNWQLVKPPPASGGVFGIKAVASRKNSVWVGTTQGLWRFEEP